jgi:rhamnosyl/mannosyltransferase
MRVLHVYKDYYPPIHGGIEVTINQIVQVTRDRLEDVQVLVANRQMRTETVEVDGIRVTKVFDFGRFRSSPLAPTFPLWLKRAARGMDILHIHSPNPLAGVSWLATQPPAKVVIHYHSDIVRQAFLLKFYRPFLERFLDRADRIIATSPNYIQSSPFLSPRAEKCVPIPFGVDLAKFSLTPEVEREAARIRSEYGDKLVLFIGKIRYYKGLHFLIEAMKDIDAHLLVIGDGPLLGDFLRRRETLAYKDRLSFLGQVASVVPYYYAAKVFCLPSFLRSEAFAVVQIEAAACGLPVVNTRIDSGVPWVCQDGVSGLTVEPANPAALAEGVNRLLADESLRQKLSRQAQERAHREFSIATMGERILEVYRDVTRR